MTLLLRGKGTAAYVSIRRGFRSEVLREAFTEAVERGWSYRISGSTHVFLTDGASGLQMSTTANDRRAIQNTLANMRRKGAIEETKNGNR